MSSRPFFLLPLCFVSALALNAYAALDPTGVYQDYLEKLDAATPPVAAMATAAAERNEADYDKSGAQYPCH